MPTDRINQTVTLKDGRRLGFAEYGARTGRPVFHFHGSASSRFEHPSAESLLDQMGIRFISVDRPGHGLSDFQPQRRLVDWPEDVCHLADHLGIGEPARARPRRCGPHCRLERPPRSHRAHREARSMRSPSSTAFMQAERRTVWVTRRV